MQRNKIELYKIKSNLTNPDSRFPLHLPLFLMPRRGGEVFL